MKILVVDDVFTVRKIILKHLGSLGYTKLFQAENGLEAWNMLIGDFKRGEPFEFVICDCKMPRMDGFELLERARKKTELADTPFLMIAADSDQKSVIKSVRLGADEFVVKPIDRDILESKMSKIFSEKREGKKLPEQIYPIKNFKFFCPLFR